MIIHKYPKNKINITSFLCFHSQSLKDSESLARWKPNAFNFDAILKGFKVGARIQRLPLKQKKKENTQEDWFLSCISDLS